MADDSHSILFPNNELKTPLILNGIASFFPSRRPTKAKIEQCSHIELTSSEPEWNPNHGTYLNGESRLGTMAAYSKMDGTKCTSEGNHGTVDI
jgi:hypothetical protein